MLVSMVKQRIYIIFKIFGISLIHIVSPDVYGLQVIVVILIRRIRKVKIT